MRRRDIYGAVEVIRFQFFADVSDDFIAFALARDSLHGKVFVSARVAFVVFVAGNVFIYRPFRAFDLITA